MAKAIFAEAGISAIPLSIPDVMVGLQSKMVDVVYAPPTGAISLQWFTRVKYMTDVPLIYLIAGIVVRKQVYDRLPVADRTTLVEAFTRHMAELKGIIRAENQDAKRVIAKHGVEIIPPSSGQVEEFKKLSEKALKKTKRMPFSQAVYDELLSHLVDFRRAK
jgi:TRAP-type C4-dicarboxylate transport system substrate-binding protein